MQLLKEWNDFWFAKKSPGPLGLFRIAIGCIFVFWGLLTAPPNLYIWYSERGVMPLSFYTMYKGSQVEISLLNSVSDPKMVFAAWIAFLIFAVLFAAGFCTRIFGFLLFIMYLSFNNRDPLILNSGDSLLRCILFLLVLSPCGASCSVDRLIAIARGHDAGGDPENVELWTQRLLQIQLALVYCATVVSKISGRDWLNGTAVYFPLHMDELTRYPLPSFLYLPWATNILTWGTLVCESCLATFIWMRRARPYVLTAGVMLHSGIEYALNIPLFSLIMCTTYVNFIYNEWLENGVSALSRSFARYRLALTLPAGVSESDRWWRVIERMDVFRLLQLREVDGNSVPNLSVSGRGWDSIDAEAVRRILLCLPALWMLSPVLAIPATARFLTPFLPHPSSSCEPAEVSISSAN